MPDGFKNLAESNIVFFQCSVKGSGAKNAYFRFSSMSLRMRLYSSVQEEGSTKP